MIKLTLLESIFALTTSFLGGTGTLYAFFRHRTNQDKKTTSELKKDTKISDVEGDEAIVKQIDFLLNQIANMSESMLKDKMELASSKTNEIIYKNAITHIRLACNGCKDTIDKVLNNLNIKDHE
jgi:hypothetical protein